MPGSQNITKVAVIGGSNSVMRNGYLKYFADCILEKSDINIKLSYFSLGGVTNLFGVIQNHRYKIAENHDIILFEYCINDRGAVAQSKYTPRMAGMALEGFIRQAKHMNPFCVIIILIFGTNTTEYYNNCCYTSAVYESIARRYDIPVINTTEILLATKGINFIKSLYEENDAFHFAQPEGVEKIGNIIAQYVLNKNLFNCKTTINKKYYRTYAYNLQNLKFFDKFNFHFLKKEVFKNSLFEEKVYTLTAHYSLNLQLKGRLLGILIKSDWYDGLFEIKFGEQVLTTSSFSKHVKQEGKANINLISLPYKKSMQCKNFSDLTISVCQNYGKSYELDAFKTNPQVDPQFWKLSIVGIAYTGEMKISN